MGRAVFTGEDRVHKTVTLAVTCVGFFMVLLDASIVTVALPTIQSDLSASLSGLQWVIDAYTLTFAVLLLTYGTLGDKYGRKKIFSVGLVLFTVGSLLCGIAPNLALLNAGRAIQGIGGAALAPASLSLLAAAFPDSRERTRAISLWAAISGVALAAGPIVGGALIVGFGWRAVFFVNLPIGMGCLAFGTKALRESTNPTAGRFDLPGQLTSIAGLTALTYAFIEGNTKGWSSPVIVGCFAAAAGLLTAFIAVERRSAAPMLPMGFFRDRVFTAASTITFLAGFALLSSVFFVSQFFQEVQGNSAIGSGVRTLPTTTAIFLLAPLAGKLAADRGFRLPIALGGLLAGAGMLALIGVHADTGYGRIWWALALIGGGFGLMLSPLSAAVLSAVSPQRSGLASSTLNVSRQVGAVIGVALLGALVQARIATHVASELAATALPDAVKHTAAGTISKAGAAAKPPAIGLPGVAPDRLHTIVADSFANAIHGAFLTNGVLLLTAAALAALFLHKPTVAIDPPPGQ